MHFVEPKAFLIAQTSVNDLGMQEALKEIGIEEWKTDATSEAELLSEFAGKSCYLSFDKSLNQNLTVTGARNNHDYLQKGIIATGHGSVLEHSTVTFFLANVSRVVTHELVRHRAGTAFSQTSGRYVRSDDIGMYFPKELEKYAGAKELFRSTTAMIERMQQMLVDLTKIENTKDFGLKKRLTSAFRRLIGNGQANHLVMTANHRAWRHIIAERTSVHAEEEIRVIVSQVAEQLKRLFPAIYADMTENDEGEWVFGSHKV